MSAERWLPIPGWEGLYEVSDHGQVRSLARTVTGPRGLPQRIKSRILKQRPTHEAYRAVVLFHSGKRTHRLVHRLVLTAFVEPCPEGMESCHNDGDQTNNHLSNLRWDTKSANVLDLVKHGNHAQARKTHCAQGHLYDETNTAARSGGGRHCRTCRAEWAKQSGQKRRKKSVA